VVEKVRAHFDINTKSYLIIYIQKEIWKASLIKYYGNFHRFSAIGIQEKLGIK